MPRHRLPGRDQRNCCSIPLNLHHNRVVEHKSAAVALLVSSDSASVFDRLAHTMSAATASSTSTAAPASRPMNSGDCNQSLLTTSPTMVCITSNDDNPVEFVEKRVVGEGEAVVDCCTTSSSVEECVVEAVACGLEAVEEARLLAETADSGVVACAVIVGC